MTPRAKKTPKRKAKSATAVFEELLDRPNGRGRRYVLRLYVTGTTLRSSRAIANIRALCDEYLTGHYDLEVVDIYQQPAAVAEEQIIAAPTLIKKSPKPLKRMVGDLSDREKVIVGLDLVAKSKWVKV
jgi:circadian clock protein KaiB